MRLLDEDEIINRKNKEKKLRNIIIVAIVVLFFICLGLISLIFYMSYNPNKITTYIDGKVISNFDELLDFQTDENGNTIIYVPIKEVAPYFGYKSYNGEYKTASEDGNQCYVIKEKNEVAMYANDSKVIYKLNLENDSEEYEYCYSDSTVFKSKDKLYTSIDGIEKGFNIEFSYDENKKIINIYTIDYLIEYYNNYLGKTPLGQDGLVKIDDNFINWKSVFDDMLVVVSSEGKYGVVNTTNFSYILEAKYDKIEYIQNSSDFLVESNKKYGIISKDGKTKIKASYDELTLMDRDAQIYRTKKDNKYGVINSNEKVIIYPEYTKIGIDASSFIENGIKNGYVILNKLIPVQKEQLWGFFDIKGNQITDFKYTSIGCKVSGTNQYNLLAIPEKNVIVVATSEKKYDLIDLTGKQIFQEYYNQTVDSMYILTSAGVNIFKMTLGSKEGDVLDTLNIIESK